MSNSCSCISSRLPRTGLVGLGFGGTFNRDIGVILGLYRDNGRENRKY